MDFKDDYGDIRHKHSHIHSQPEKHQQVVNTALKEWCLNIYKEDGEEKCKDLDQSFFDTLITGSVNEIDLSNIFKIINDMSKLKSNEDGINLTIDGTNLIINLNGTIFKKEIILNDKLELLAIFSLKKKLIGGESDEIMPISDESQILEDAISGLVNLGYGRSEVFTVVMKIKRELTMQQKNKELTFDNIIPLALKYLSKETK